MEKVIKNIVPWIEAFGKSITDTVFKLGDWCVFTWEFFTWLFKKPYRWHNIFKQMEFLGVKSVPIILLTGVFVGMVFSFQTGKAFGLFNAESLVGATMGLSLTREIGPVFTALMVTARACSAMAAEIGTMKVTEQVDALHAMAVNPIHFLVVPRVVAATVMVPLLAGIFNLMGIVGAYLVGVNLLHINASEFMYDLYYYVDADDVLGGLIKAMIFGFLIALISCYMGYRASKGAEGVGKATTRAVVVSSVTILVVDYFVTTWVLEFL
ncbi:ABC transporter permease [bacterium]|nr:ABC transporter permease [bacterium]